MSDNVKVLLAGAGYMGKEYCKVLKAQGQELTVIGRGLENAKKMEQELGVSVLPGGVEAAWKELGTIPECAVVAVSVEQLAAVSSFLIEHGVKRLLVEKPAGLNRAEIKALKEKADQAQAEVYVAYNRRFYASTEKAMEIIAADGGVTSFHFEFTEWGHVVEKTKHPAKVKEAWMLGNSSHVIDLAFFLGGEPKEFASYFGGGVPWHKHCSIYTGAGISYTGALFSYQADWGAPGRWSVEMLTKKHRLYWKPMEQLAVQEAGSVQVKPVELADTLEKEFKPGLYQQTAAFLDRKKKDARLLTIGDQLRHMDFYEKMEGLNK